MHCGDVIRSMHRHDRRYRVTGEIRDYISRIYEAKSEKEAEEMLLCEIRQRCDLYDVWAELLNEDAETRDLVTRTEGEKA